MVTGHHSPGYYSLNVVFIAEVVMTFIFFIIILGATDNRAPARLFPIAMGLGLSFIHFITLLLRNTSVNPARSKDVALFQGYWAMSQLWLFWFAPIVAATIAELLYRWFEED